MVRILPVKVRAELPERDALALRRRAPAPPIAVLEALGRHRSRPCGELTTSLGPYQAPNANAYAERFVRSIKEECLDRIVPLGEHHLRRAVNESVAHYHQERNHQGLRNALIDGSWHEPTGHWIRRRPRLGGLLNFYERAA